MNPTEPTDDLERDLSARPQPPASGPFRQRVLSAMRAELQHPAVPVAAAPIWRFVGLTAAAALLAINFSMSVAGDCDFHLTGQPPPAQLNATAKRLRDLSPELSEDEAFRHALVLRAGSGVCAVPESRSFPIRMVYDKEQ